MIRNGERMNEVEQLRQGERQPPSLHLVVHGHRIARTEEPEQRLPISVAPSSALFASGEGFITDWADS
jgi:hypothetical protein